jgi:hypothetical protein
MPRPQLETLMAGWKSNPLVGVAAVVVIILAVVIGFRCSRGGGETAAPIGLPEAKAVVLICPSCKHQFEVTEADVRDDTSDDYLVVKALRKPCPKCGKTGCEEAVQCLKCGKYFLPMALTPPVATGPPSRDPAAAARERRGAAGGPACPHCGKDPYTK